MNRAWSLAEAQFGNIVIAALLIIAASWFTIGALRADRASFSELAGATSIESNIEGDVSCDGEVTTIDAMFILQLDAGLISNYLTCAGNGDIDEDGRVGPIDALLILQYRAGIIGSLP